MKRLILLMTIVCLLITTNAIANPTAGYSGSMGWSRGASGSTWQEWDFLTDPQNNASPSAPITPENYYNPYPGAPPTATLYEVPVPSGASIGFGWRSSYGGRDGVWAGDAVYADLAIPNTELTDGYKIVWMEVGYAAINPDSLPTIEPIASGGSGVFDCELLEYSNVSTGEGDWNVMTVCWRITPNPQFETITFGFYGTGGYIDYVTVDTMCVVPVPGAIVLGGIGIGIVGWLRRRKSIV